MKELSHKEFTFIINSLTEKRQALQEYCDSSGLSEDDLYDQHQDILLCDTLVDLFKEEQKIAHSESKKIVAEKFDLDAVKKQLGLND